ncbi:hypothetical protein ZIOFF_033301 [Zingiber officinale]|uniref:Uncharacterized protein n=1 Tax=Zingiber officinale TaxID=94328 RepID=A0A8J5GK40_ZINOF|nr:hypothetical protein ZIOFF_033301 [Zingiber officinale]
MKPNHCRLLQSIDEEITNHCRWLPDRSNSLCSNPMLNPSVFHLISYALLYILYQMVRPLSNLKGAWMHPPPSGSDAAAAAATTVSPQSLDPLVHRYRVEKRVPRRRRRTWRSSSPSCAECTTRRSPCPLGEAPPSFEWEDFFGGGTEKVACEGGDGARAVTPTVDEEAKRPQGIDLNAEPGPEAEGVAVPSPLGEYTALSVLPPAVS